MKSVSIPLEQPISMLCLTIIGTAADQEACPQTLSFVTDATTGCPSIPTV
jgi:hypothetical protein